MRRYRKIPLTWMVAIAQVAATMPESVTEWARQAFGFEADPLQRPILDCDALRVIACTSRQVGKSTVAALRALYLALKYPGSLILMIGPVGSQAGEILEKAREFAAELGFRIRGDGINKQSLRLPNGSRLVARPAVSATSRGYSQARLIIVDEAAFVPDGIFRSITPSLGISRGSLWVLSTPHGQAGEFARFWHDQDNGFARFSITADQCPRFTPEFLAAERYLHGELSYAQEYLCQFISEGVQLLTREQVQASFITAAPVPTLALQGETRYYFGLDLGKRQDHSALVVVELTWAQGPRNHATQGFTRLPQLTVRYAARLPLGYETTGLPRFVRDAAQSFPLLAALRHPGTLLVDATGNGHTVIELLRGDRNGLLLKPVTISSGYKSRQLADNYYSIPRTDLLTRLKLLFERGLLKIERPAAGMDFLERELIQFEPSGRQQEHDDLIMALSLAIWQAVEDHKDLIGLPGHTPVFATQRVL
ncbi:MAG: hypothetical protein B7X34_10025 [Acidobacteriia bacterium 12-62-4]|nr:MAG: hypothetical protein B7X34_10025 [Acidobacteriia bacterium 12-62-4]